MISSKSFYENAVCLPHQCVVRSSAGRCPASPMLLTWTLPFGEMVTHVMEPFLRLIRSHAWGFTW